MSAAIVDSRIAEATISRLTATDRGQMSVPSVRLFVEGRMDAFVYYLSLCAILQDYTDRATRAHNAR